MGLRFPSLAFVVAACLALASCFTSETPLFGAGRGQALLGSGLLTVETHQGGAVETNRLRWTTGGYVDPEQPDEGVVTFHRLPGAPWSGLWVGQTRLADKTSAPLYSYAIFRKDGDKIYFYDAACQDLTDAEAAAAGMRRTEAGAECRVGSVNGLTRALRAIAKRKPAAGYWTVSRP